MIGRFLAVAFCGISVFQPALAQPGQPFECDRVLELTRKITQVSDKKYSREVLAYRYYELGYEGAKTELSGSATVPIKGVPLSGSMSRSTYNEFRKQVEQTMNFEQVRQHQVQILVSEANSDAIKAWQACAIERAGLNGFLRDLGNGSFELTLRYDRQPTGPNAVKLSDFVMENLTADPNGAVDLLPPGSSPSAPTFAFFQRSIRDGAPVTLLLRRKGAGSVGIVTNASGPIGSVSAWLPEVKPEPALVVQSTRLQDYQWSPTVANAGAFTPGVGARVYLGDQTTIIEHGILLWTTTTNNWASVQYNLEGHFQTFEAVVGNANLDSDVGPCSATGAWSYRVFLDDVEIVAPQAVSARSRIPLRFRVEGANVMRLEVNSGDSRHCDHPVFANAVLTKLVPQN
jgi:hypothetical protein